jgi:Ca2+-binding RTX toxin-like protein
MVVRTGTSFSETLRGTRLSDSLYGLGGNDTLIGKQGNDYLDGGTGNDRMEGGKGNDTYIVDSTGFFGSSSDQVVENFNQGIDTVRASVSYTLGTNVENLTLTGFSAINGTGNTLNNYIIGNSAANRLDGGFGNDTIDGGSGNDTLLGGDGNDSLIGGLGSDTISGGNGNDTINGYGTSAFGGTQLDTLSGGTDGQFDRFVLGGSWGYSYQGTGYATITDWNSSFDTLVLKGSASQYNVSFQNIGGSASLDTVISLANNTGDYIAVLQDTTSFNKFSNDAFYV